MQFWHMSWRSNFRRLHLGCHMKGPTLEVSPISANQDIDNKVNGASPKTRCLWLRLAAHIWGMWAAGGFWDLHIRLTEGSTKDLLPFKVAAGRQKILSLFLLAGKLNISQNSIDNIYKKTRHTELCIVCKTQPSLSIFFSPFFAFLFVSTGTSKKYCEQFRAYVAI